jgi:hypothetical protein
MNASILQQKRTDFETKEAASAVSRAIGSSIAQTVAASSSLSALPESAVCAAVP